MRDYTNSEISAAIDEYIHSAKVRELLKERLIDGLTYREIAERHDISERNLYNIIAKGKNKIFSHL